MLFLSLAEAKSAWMTAMFMGAAKEVPQHISPARSFSTYPRIDSIYGQIPFGFTEMKSIGQIVSNLLFYRIFARMSFIPPPGARLVHIRERSDLVSMRKELPTERKVAKKAWSMDGNNHVVLPARVRPVPVSDLSIFGGSVGPRRFYKAEKETIPDFSGKLEDQWHSSGDNIVLRIGYKGYPEPSVQWFKGQEPLIADPHSTKVVITDDGAYTELALFDAHRADGGYYSCRLENGNGVREMGCHVFITEPMPTSASGPGGSQRAYRSVLHSSIHTPSMRYSRF